MHLSPQMRLQTELVAVVAEASSNPAFFALDALAVLLKTSWRLAAWFVVFLALRPTIREILKWPPIAKYAGRIRLSKRLLRFLLLLAIYPYAMGVIRKVLTPIFGVIFPQAQGAQGMGMGRRGALGGKGRHAGGDSDGGGSQGGGGGGGGGGEGGEGSGGEGGGGGEGTYEVTPARQRRLSKSRKAKEAAEIAVASAEAAQASAEAAEAAVTLEEAKEAVKAAEEAAAEATQKATELTEMAKGSDATEEVVMSAAAANVAAKQAVAAKKRAERAAESKRDS